MRAYDLIELAGRNLREAGLRNSLTTLGIGVGVASLVAMLSLGIGLQKLATRQLGRSGLFDTVVVTARGDSRGPRFSQAAPVNGQSKPLDDAARHSFEQMANVAEVYPNFSAVGDLRLEGAQSANSHFSVVGTLPPSARNSESFGCARQYWVTQVSLAAPSVFWPKDTLTPSALRPSFAAVK